MPDPMFRLAAALAASVNIRPADYQALTVDILSLWLADPVSALAAAYALRHDATLATVQVWGAAALAGTIGIFAIAATLSSASAEAWTALGCSVLFVVICVGATAIAWHDRVELLTAADESVSAAVDC
jgi:hypothetical protein